MKEVNQYVLKAAFNIARKNKAQAVFVHADPLEDLIFEEKWPWKFDLYLLSKKKKWNLASQAKKSMAPKVKDVIVVPRMPFSRPSLLKLSVLLAMSSQKIQKGDKILCVVGTTDQGLLDHIQYIDTATETEIITGKATTNLSDDISPEVFEMILNFSIELAGKGREGKPVGTIIVVGDEEKVLEFSK